MQKENFDVMGMTCSACSSRVEKTVSKLPGIDEVHVNLLTNSMQLTYDEKIINPAEIIASVEKEGYGAAVKGEKQAGNNGRNSKKKIADKQAGEIKHRLLWSLVFLLPMMYVSMHSTILAWAGIPVPDAVRSVFDGPENAVTFAFAQFLLVLPIMYLNRHFYIVGFRMLFRRTPNMDTLVGMGSMSAAFFGVFALFRIGWGLGHGDMALVTEYCSNLYFESAGMIVTLITVGKYLEARAKGQTSKALEKLIDMAPRRATVIRDGVETAVDVEELAVGDTVIVRPGEQIPADGVIVEGMTSIDESAISGESIPVAKRPGDRVVSATFNKNGVIRFTAQRVGEDSTIRQIIRLVDEASASKAPIAKLADRVAGVFVPAVIAVAVLAGGIWLAMGASIEFAFSIAISILVISCPCALGLATPVAIMVGTGKGAEHGILIKSGEALETAYGIDTVVIDKTGTITEGHPRVTDVQAVGVSEDELLSVAAGLEAGSEHPLAEAIVTYAKEKHVVPRAVENFKAVFGRGVQAEEAGRRYLAGNQQMMEEAGIDTGAFQGHLYALADEGCTPLLFARDKEIIGIVGVADVEKPTSAKAIACFKEMGIDVVMLTGDNERTAEAIRRRMNIPSVIAGVLPENKVQHIEALQAKGHKVAMIGDGINDAPALAKADLGIAIGAGTDVAIESADAVLMKNDLLDAVRAVRLSKAVIRNIKENLFWAFIYNIICIPVAAGLLYPVLGIKLEPVMGAAAMSLSSVFVCLNALRLRRFRMEDKPALVTASVAEENMVVPALRAEKIEKNVQNVQQVRKEENKMEKTLKIEGMMCAHCQKHVTEALSAMDGVTEVVVDLNGGKAEVKTVCDISQEKFKKVIEEAGYELID